MSRLVDAEFVRAGLRAAMERDGIPPEDELPDRAAAVAVVVHMTAGGPAMLWIRRAEHPGDPWSGQMGFPGGREDPGDETSRHTAERETLEEVGLDLVAAGEYLGALGPLPARNRRQGVTAFRIEPHAYWVAKLPPLVPDAREVAAVHSVPLVDLVNPEHATTTTIDWRGTRVTLPGIDWQGRLLWGLSFHILQDLLARVRTTELGEHLGVPARLRVPTVPMS